MCLDGLAMQSSYNAAGGEPLNHVQTRAMIFHFVSGKAKDLKLIYESETGKGNFAKGNDVVM
jgi:hypothetical protein